MVKWTGSRNNMREFRPWREKYFWYLSDFSLWTPFTLKVIGNHSAESLLLAPAISIKAYTVVPLILHHSHNALPPKMHRVWRWRSWSKGNYIGIMHNLPNCIMHEDLGHPKTEYAFWEVLIWCHNPAISSIFCIESDQMSGMNHKHSIKSPDRPNILVKCYIRHAVTLNTSCI